MHKDEVEEVLTELILQDFINEERYAKSYCRGKFRNNQWGKVKIKRVLESKGISSYCIQKGLLEIDEEEYRLRVVELVHKKDRNLPEDLDPWIKKNKVAQYLLNKGFESSLVWEVIEQKDW